MSRTRLAIKPGQQQRSHPLAKHGKPSEKGEVVLTSFPCQRCGAETGVIDSRVKMGEHEPYLRRRRSCKSCGFRFTTLESSDFEDVVLARVHTYVGGRAMKNPPARTSDKSGDGESK